jgi:ferritin-like metal-binding protein YciE
MNTFKSPFLGQLENIPNRVPGAVKALPKRPKAATYDDLKKSIVAHFKETEDQVTKLERMFHSVG